ncbi:MAG: hypothetical protein CVV13_01755 [Gammaproteobacteria bacterium HGW-Gammaproteobacteria-3]|nr:MAG: hypothetical protein CVV13_01755 [Gammaproteobacteria bacterium HGW-Gammaproteobacteria-3]
MSYNTQLKDNRISIQDYLEGELISEVKHEYRDGYVYAMAGASRNHERITGNVFAEIRNLLKNKPCEPFSSDLKIKVGDSFFYPDVMVVCEEQSAHDYYTESPVMIVEVISRSSRKMDETTKRKAYQSLPSLQEYILIEQDIVDVEVCRKSEGWVSRHFFMGDTVTFEAIGLTLPVEEIYDRVENEDVRSFLQERAQQQLL